MGKWIALFVIVLAGGVGWMWITKAPLNAQPANLSVEPAIGHIAPEFSLNTLDGDIFSLQATRGTPVVLNFWATWCGPCRREMPALESAAQRYQGEVLIVGVDQGEDAATVQAFVDELGLTFAIAMDTQMSVGELYNVRGMPTTYFVDAGGVIRHIWAGEMNSVTLAEGIAKIWP